MDEESSEGRLVTAVILLGGTGGDGLTGTALWEGSTVENKKDNKDLLVPLG